MKRTEGFDCERTVGTHILFELAHRKFSSQVIRRAHVAGEVRETRGNARSVFALEHRKELVSNPISRDRGRFVAAVANVSAPESIKVGNNIGATDRQERTDEHPRPALRHPAEARDRGPAKQPQHHGFRLIVGMMSESDMRRPNIRRYSRQKIESCLSRSLFEVGHRSPKSVGAPDMKRDVVFGGKLAHECFVAIGFGAADSMIEMRSRDADPKPFAKGEHRAHKRYGVGSTGECNEDMRSSFDSDQRQNAPYATLKIDDSPRSHGQ